MYNFRTDLALERRDIYQKMNNLKQIDGIESTEEQIDEKIKVSRVKITNQNGEKAIGKPVGNYITIDVKNLKLATDEDIQKTADTLTNELRNIIDIHTDKQGDILIVGLGNIYVTPDSLGPKVINEIDVTRHIIKYLPQYVEEGTREVSAVSPGVLGTTGIETEEIVESVTKVVKPDVLIVIDSLASMSMNRLGTTIQLGNTGITPGAGIGNKRRALNKESLGVEVIAIGVPTVVDMATITNEAIDKLTDNLKNEATNYMNHGLDKEKIEEIFSLFDRDDRYNMIANALHTDNYIVTPKEIDNVILKISEIIASGLNTAL